MANVEFRAYLEDCLVGGRLELPDGVRLSDYLNNANGLSLSHVALEALDDGRIVDAGDVDIPVADIHLVEAVTEKVVAERRIRTRSSEIEMVLGPYRVQGYVHGPTAGDPVAALPRRLVMVPMTTAKIAFWLAGELQVREREVVIVNRLLADIRTPEPLSPSVLEGFGLSPADPRAKDLTGELKVDLNRPQRPKGR